MRTHDYILKHKSPVTLQLGFRVFALESQVLCLTKARQSGTHAASCGPCKAADTHAPHPWLSRFLQNDTSVLVTHAYVPRARSRSFLSNTDRKSRRGAAGGSLIWGLP